MNINGGKGHCLAAYEKSSGKERESGEVFRDNIVFNLN